VGVALCHLGGLDPEQQVIVTAPSNCWRRRVNKEVFALQNVARFRSTDNWWNHRSEHHRVTSP
jgi:hypothetical protein